MPIKYNLENIELKPLFGQYTVHICNYLICKEEYILYLLELINNEYYFPHFISKNNVLEEVEENMIRLKLDGKIKGYYLLNNNCYVIIQLHMNIMIENISPYIFASIYEIIFMRTCLGKQITNSVIQLFIQFSHLLYLYNDVRKPIPELGYYITTTSDINFNAYIGLDSNEDGNIVIYNKESLPEKPFLRVLSTLENYKVKEKSSVKSRTIIVKKYIVVSYHKN